MAHQDELDLDRKNELHDAIKKVLSRILDIDGAHSKTIRALIAVEALYNAAIDDEVLGDCPGCGEHIWLSDETSVANDDGDYFCRHCVSKWNETHHTGHAGKEDR